MSESAFRAAVYLLRRAHDKLAAGEISAFDHRNIREEALSTALTQLAKLHDIQLHGQAQVNSNGEILLMVANKDGRDPRYYGCGAFGKKLAVLLNQHSPRTGTGPALIDQANGWCYLNHFAAERMVMDYYQSIPFHAAA